MGEVIIRTKITPEKNISNLVSRDDLLEELKKNSDRQLIVLSGGAGYGKTSLAKQFVFSRKLKTAWYSIDETDDNLFVFLSYLISSISESDEKAGRGALDILESIQNREGAPSSHTSVINTVCGTLINDISNYIKDEMYIVLDDLHLLPDEEWAGEVLDYLLKYLPLNVHLLITTREKLPINTGKLKAKRKFYMISEGLKFTGEEVQKLAGKEYNVELTDDDTQIIEKIDGWITGLHLYLQGDRERGAEFIKEGVLPENMYSFFAEDIFASEDDKVKEFLLNSAVLENFTAKDCDEIFKMKNSAEVLGELFGRNVFINQMEIIDGGKQEYIYNYQSLFRDFLKRKLDEKVSEAVRVELYRKVGEYYKKSDLSKAIKYYLLAGDFETALEFIKDFYESSTGSINFPVIESRVAMFPDEMKTGNPFIVFYKGNIEQVLYGNTGSALELFERSAEMFKTIKETGFYVKCIIWVSYLKVNQGKNSEAIELVEETLKKKISPADKAKLLYRLGTAYSNLFKYDKALEVFQEALEISNVEDVKEIRYSLHNDLGNLYLIRGDYEKAEFYYESVIANISNVYHKFQTITNAVQVYAYAGEFDKAKKLSNKAEEFVTRYSSQYFKINFLLSSAYLSYMLCDYEESIKTWKELISLSVKSGLAYYVYVGNLNVGICNYYLKKYEAAREYYEIALDTGKGFDEGEKIYLNYWRALLDKAAGNLKSVEDNITKAREYYSDKSMMYEKVHSAFHLADYYLCSGNKKKALQLIEEVFKEGKERKFTTLFEKEFLFNRAVFDAAAEEKIGRDFIDLVVSGISLKKDPGSYDIKLSVLGEIKLWIRGKEVPENKWVRKIRKLILAYIFLNKKSITKDSLIDEFYPDSEPENANSVFHQTLSNFRSIFKWAVDAKGKENVPEFVVYENQRITLNQNYLYYIDAFEFEELHKKGSAGNVNDKDRIMYYEDALSLFKGELLEGYYQPWCEEMREQYNNYFFSMVESLIEIFKNEGDYEKLAEYSRMLIKADNLNEEAYIDVIEAEMKLGSDAKAKEAYKSMIKTFKKELGEEPSAETKNKIEELFK